MRILFILDEFLPENTGGAANVAFGLAKGLIKAGHELMVLTATNDLQKTGELEIESVKIKVILTKPFGRLRNWKNLKNRDILRKSKIIFENFEPDVVHIHTLHHRFSYGIIDLAKRNSKKIFLTLHDAQTIFNGKLFPKRKICGLKSECDYKISWLDNLKRDGLGYNPFQKFFIKKALRKADRIFSVSDALKDALNANGVFNVETIHNGIDAEEWAVGEKVGSGILFAGRVDEAKGVKALIDAFGEVSSKIPDATLTIVGGGIKTERGENIKILPWQSREETKKLFAEAAVVVVPSIYLDPFPTVNLEAMAARKPVVGTCFGGTPEAVIDSKTGYIVNPYNVDALAAKIIDLLKNPEKARAFGEAGRHLVRERFSIDTVVENYLSFFSK